MPLVTLVLEAQEAQLVGALVKVVNSQKKAEAGFKAIGTAGRDMERQVITSQGRIVEALRRTDAATRPMSTQRMAQAYVGNVAERDAITREFERQKTKAEREAMNRRRAEQMGLFNNDPSVTGLNWGGAEDWALQQAKSAIRKERAFAKLGAVRNALQDKVNAEREGDASDLAGRQSMFASSYWAGRDEETATKNLHNQLKGDIAFNNFDAKVARMEKAKLRRREMVSNMVGGAAIVGAGIYAAGRFYDHAQQQLDKVGVFGLQFNEEMRPLLALGDNLSDVPGQKMRVRGLSTGLGIDTGDASKALFMLQSAAANLGESGQKEILGGGSLLTRVAGGSLETNVVAVTKLMQTYGKEMGTADVAANKLLLTQDQAAVSMEELSSLLPDILPATKLMGVAYDDLAASLITATQVLGSNEKTFTGFRNMILQLPEAMKMGLVQKGPYLEMLRELASVKPEKLIEIFGEKTVSVVSALATKSGEVVKNARMMAQGGAAGLEKFGRRLADPVTFDAEVLKSAGQQLKNADAIKFDDPWLRKRALAMKLTEAGYEMSDDPLAEMLDVTGLGKKLNMTVGMLSGDDNADMQVAIAHQIDALTKAGDAASRMQADRMKILYRPNLQRGNGYFAELGDYLTGALHGDNMFTSYNSFRGARSDERAKVAKGELDEFDQLHEQGFGMSAEAFQGYRELMNRGDKPNAKMMLARHASSAGARKRMADYYGSDDVRNWLDYHGTAGQRDFAGSYGQKAQQYDMVRMFNKDLSFEDYLGWSEMAGASPASGLSSVVKGAGAKLKGFKASDMNVGAASRAAMGLLAPGGLAALPINAGLFNIGDGAKGAREPRGALQQLSGAASALLKAAGVLDEAGEKLLKGKDYIPKPPKAEVEVSDPAALHNQ